VSPVFTRLALSAGAWVAAVLVASFLVELFFGTRRQGFVTLLTLPILGPLLFVIWRRRPPAP
jgi:hypothetical protein